MAKMRRLGLSAAEERGIQWFCGQSAPTAMRARIRCHGRVGVEAGEGSLERAPRDDFDQPTTFWGRSIWAFSRAMTLLWIWQTRDSVSSMISPISRIVSPS